MKREHPRVCGGTNSTVWVSTEGSGASPYTRGSSGAKKEFSVERWGPSPRSGGTSNLCPRRGLHAGASPYTRGEPRLKKRRRKAWRGHPRIRGGTMPGLRGVLPTKGPSPYTRGNRYSRFRFGGPSPHTAGDSLPQVSRSLRSPEHPHMRGGTNLARAGRAHQNRSIPAKRGNPRYCEGLLCKPGTIPVYTGEPKTVGYWRPGMRSIPAYAGEPFDKAAKWGTKMEHPRIHGGT